MLFVYNINRMDSGICFALSTLINARKIALIAKERSANMLIMGLHGSTGKKGFSMGSVTDSVIVNALCPVLAATFIESGNYA